MYMHSCALGLAIVTGGASIAAASATDPKLASTQQNIALTQVVIMENLLNFIRNRCFSESFIVFRKAVN